MKGLIAAILGALAVAATARDVTVIGEVHDNPAHHALQAERVAAIRPAALVFEMLTPDQAAAITPQDRGDATTLARALDWDAGGWPDFALYYPIFSAAPGARIYGAGLAREAAHAAMQGRDAASMAGDAAIYGLDRPLPAPQQAAREALQMQAHCNALPKDMLPGMVRVQRLRDAMLARATLRAHRQTGGPVVVITGNGHARRDWGMPAALSRLAPGLDIHVIGQTEDGAPLAGTFDEVISAPAVDREDPCAAFR